MNAKEAVQNLMDKPENLRLKRSCYQAHSGIDSLIELLDEAVDAARQNVDPDETASFERELWDKMRCYCLLSDRQKGIIAFGKNCSNPVCPR